MAQGTITAPVARVARARRVPLPYQLAVVALILLGVGAYFGYSALSGASTPRATAESFLVDLQRGDASAAWKLMSPPAAPDGLDATALDEASLVAALGTERPKFTGLKYMSSGSIGPLTSVGFSYVGAGGLEKVSVLVARDPSRKRFLAGDGYAVHLSPITVETIAPGFSGGLSVDGRRLKLPADRTVRIALLPLPHRLTLESGASTTAVSVNVNGLSGLTDQRVAFTPSLTGAATDKVRSSALDAFTACSMSLGGGCPGSVRLGRITRFEEVAAPSLTAVTYNSDKGRWLATGLYQAILTYVYTSGGEDHHVASAGIWEAPVSVTASGVSVGAIGGPTSTPASFPKPATIDEASVRQLVAAAFAACAGRTTMSPADCPQTNSRAIGTESEVRWHLKGDPISGSRVAFDESRGVIQVMGQYAMSVDFRLEGSRFSNDIGTNAYTADLIATPSGLRLVSIQSS